MGNGIAACRAEMTVDGQTKEIWLSRSESLDPPPPRTVTFRDSVYQVVYDVDRKPLGFELKLDDFDMGFEPGTEQPTHFVSEVRLTDKSAGDQGPAAYDLDEPPARPSRLHVLPVELHSACATRDTSQSTGQFQSVFQVATNPGRPIIYGGCFLVVLGRIPPVLHAGGNLHRRRQARARACRHRRQEESRAGHEDRMNSNQPVRHRRGRDSVLSHRAIRLERAVAFRITNNRSWHELRETEHETNRQATRWDGTGRDVGGRLPARGADDSQVAGGRPGL